MPSRITFCRAFISAPWVESRALDPDSATASEALRSFQTLGFIPYDDQGASFSLLYGGEGAGLTHGEA